MPLGLKENGSGEFIPYLNYNAKAGRWYIAEGEGDNKRDVEVQQQDVVFVADLENIQVGWAKFAKGMAPDYKMARYGEPEVAQPSPDHKSGFKLKVYSEKNLGGLREWSAASGVANKAMNELFTAFEAEAANHPGQCPVVRFTGAIPETNKHGTNYRPGFEIVQWTARPAAFDDDGDEAPQQTAQPAPAQPSAPPPPPPVTPVPAASQAADVQF